MKTNFKNPDIMKLIWQFFKFSLTGSIVTFFSLIIYWLCIYLDISYVIANAIGFVITVAISYILNNTFTFTNKGKKSWSWKALLRVYMTYFLTGVLVATFFLWLWIEVLEINNNIAPLLNLFITIPLNFIMNKFWVYRRS